jgi:hypothetical protein
MTKGRKVINKLKGRSGPNKDALISFAVFELQRGQAFTDPESVIKMDRMKNFISLS